MATLRMQQYSNVSPSMMTMSNEDSTTEKPPKFHHMEARLHSARALAPATANVASMIRLPQQQQHQQQHQPIPPHGTDVQNHQDHTLPPWRRSQAMLNAERSTVERDASRHAVRLKGRYRLGKMRGQGGFGMVYDAVDELNSNSRPLVVKAVHREESNIGLEPGLVSEVMMQQHMHHDNVVPILDATADRSQFFLVMPSGDLTLQDYLNANTILHSEKHRAQLSAVAIEKLVEVSWRQHWLKEATEARNDVRNHSHATAHPRQADIALYTQEKLAIFLDISNGLKHMHDMGLVHLDLKPDNVLLFVNSTTGHLTAKIIDFGLAQWTDAPADLSSGTGTVGFIAPEVILDPTASSVATPISDYWAMGCMLAQLFAVDPYELVAGTVADTNEVDVFKVYMSLVYNQELFHQAGQKEFRAALTRVPKIAEAMRTKFMAEWGEDTPPASSQVWLERILRHYMFTPLASPAQSSPHQSLLEECMRTYIKETLQYDPRLRQQSMKTINTLLGHMSFIAKVTRSGTITTGPAQRPVLHYHRPAQYFLDVLLAIQPQHARQTDTGSIVMTACQYVQRIPLDFARESYSTLVALHNACLLLALKGHHENDLAANLLSLSLSDAEVVVAAEQWIANTCLGWNFS